MGGQEKSIIEICFREGLPLPDEIANAPQVLWGLELYFSAYLDLGYSRSGLGDGGIPWHRVEQYARMNKFSDEQTDDLHYYVRELDDCYAQYRKAEKENKGHGNV